MEAFDPFLVESDLKDSKSIEGHFDTGALGQELDVGRVPIPRSDAESVSGAGRSLDRRREHSRCRRRRLAGTVLPDQGDFDAAFRQRGGDGQTNQAAADYDYFGAQAGDSVW